jgi:Na+-driven multidrug efflux pump
MQPTSKNLFREFLGLAVPTVLSGMLYILYTIIDGIFIGRYLGEESLAALNILVPVLYVPYALSVMVGVGGSTLVARLLGQNKPMQARRVFTQALYIILAFSAAMTIGVQSFLPEITRGLGATGALAEHVQAYLGSAVWFTLFCNLLCALELFLRTEGARAARLGLYAMALGALVNVGLDYIFIVVLKSGMEGPAIATGISFMASSLSMLGYHQFKARIVKPCRHAFSAGSHMWSIVHNGASTFLGAVAPAVVILAFNQIILRAYGEFGLAAYAILEYMTLAAWVVMMGLVQSMQPMVSFYRGAANPAAVKRSLTLGTSGILLVAVLAAVAMLLFSQPLAAVFLPSSTKAWAILEGAVPWYALSFPIAACNLVAAGYFTAIERPGASSLIALLRSWVLLFTTLWLLITWWGDGAVWFTLVITETATLLVSAYLLWRYRRVLIAVGIHR